MQKLEYCVESVISQSNELCPPNRSLDMVKNINRGGEPLDESMKAWGRRTIRVFQGTRDQIELQTCSIPVSYKQDCCLFGFKQDCWCPDSHQGLGAAEFDVGPEAILKIFGHIIHTTASLIHEMARQGWECQL